MPPSLDDRIAQFEKMCREDPENDMAHFSLAGAYNQAGRFVDAAASYVRCFELNPGFSKAYQLAGAALMASQDTERAKKVLLDGYHVAATKGDLMPKKAIAELLEKLGEPLPEIESAAPEPPAGSFMCQVTGNPGTQMARPPFKGPVGEWIRQNVSQQTFNAWIAQGTKVINELRLDLSRDEDAETYDRHMREYLGIDDNLYEQLTGRRP
ncbi:MAG TPA: Fe(2+)-trafficking protein [Phycisphaerales bacterium]|nr:Fe(2+)-trafficking protein [Phycisphaerales bacterium]